MKSSIKFLFITILLSSLSLGKDLNINHLLEQIVKENKKLMLFLHIPKCPYCDKMLRDSFKDKKTLELIEKNFVFEDIYTAHKGTVSFNDFKGTREEFVNFLGAKAFPTTMFLDYKGRVIHETMGYRDSGEYLVEIKYVKTNSYLNEDLEIFADELKSQK
ncbi:MAG: thioredoxin fold domain-containing protein [Campylobacterota bacterium]|nr:thioredoxin fold domain-containing protein [Campylobacterota bacterium]